MNFKSLLSSGVSNPILDSPSKQHLSAVHVVKHYVFQLWHQSFFVHQVEVYAVVSRYLDSDVPFVERQETSVLECVEQGPLLLLLHFVPDILEKHNVLGAPGYKAFVIDEYHLADIHVSAPIRVNLGYVLDRHIDVLALSVERVDFVVFIVIETLIWEVFSSTANFYFNEVSDHFARACVDDHVIVG